MTKVLTRSSDPGPALKWARCEEPCEIRSMIKRIARACALNPKLQKKKSYDYDLAT